MDSKATRWFSKKPKDFQRCLRILQTGTKDSQTGTMDFANGSHLSNLFGRGGPQQLHSQGWTIDCQRTPRFFEDGAMDCSEETIDLPGWTHGLSRETHGFQKKTVVSRETQRHSRNNQIFPKQPKGVSEEPKDSSEEANNSQRNQWTFQTMDFPTTDSQRKPRTLQRKPLFKKNINDLQRNPRILQRKS